MNTISIDDRASRWLSWLRRLRTRQIPTGERALIAAHGKALAMLATTLQNSGHFDATRFAEMLALLGVVVGEDDSLQGAILALWSDALQESLDLATSPGG